MTDPNDIKKVVTVELSDLIDNNLEGFLDILSEKAVGHECLMDINYKIVGHESDTILKIEVTGYVDPDDDI